MKYEFKKNLPLREQLRLSDAADELYELNRNIFNTSGETREKAIVDFKTKLVEFCKASMESFDEFDAEKDGTDAVGEMLASFFVKILTMNALQKRGESSTSSATRS